MLTSQIDMIEKIDSLIKKNNLEKYLTKRYFNYVILGCFGILGLSLNWNISILSIVLALIWLVLFPVRSQILARIAAACLVLIPVMLFLNQNRKAEVFAILAFLLLTIIAIMRFSSALGIKISKKIGIH